MIRYIDAHREGFGVEPICSALEVAPSTYYAAKSRPPCRESEPMKLNIPLLEDGLATFRLTRLVTRDILCP